MAVDPKHLLDDPQVLQRNPTGSPVSDVIRIFNDFVDTGAGTGLGTLAILYSRDDNMPLPDASTYSANAVFIKETSPSPTCAGTCYVGNDTNYVLDTSALMAATKLVYTGDVAADYHDPVTLKAIFTVLATGAPIPGATVTFIVGFQGCNAVTNASDVASCSLVLNHAAGNVTVSASTTGIFFPTLRGHTRTDHVVLYRRHRDREWRHGAHGWCAARGQRNTDRWPDDDFHAGNSCECSNLQWHH